MHERVDALLRVRVVAAAAVPSTTDKTDGLFSNLLPAGSGYQLRYAVHDLRHDSHCSLSCLEQTHVLDCGRDLVSQNRQSHLMDSIKAIFFGEILDCEDADDAPTGLHGSPKPAVCWFTDQLNPLLSGPLVDIPG